jgi:hypothetical protein
MFIGTRVPAEIEMPKKIATLPQVAKPSISDLVAEFLDDSAAAQQESHEDKKGVLALFIECMNLYGHQFLGAVELERLDRYEALKGTKRLDYCQIFGPDKVPQNAALFVGYYIIAKIMQDGKDMEDCARVVAAFCRWLGEKRYLPKKVAQEATERASKIGAVIAQSEEVNNMLWRQAQKSPSIREKYLQPGYRVVTRIEDDFVWLVGRDGQEIGPVLLPGGAAEKMEEGWTICSALLQVGARWHFAEVGNVYPDKDRGDYIVGGNP